MLPDATPLNERPAISIREDNKGRVLLSGVHQLSIETHQDLLRALEFGSATRHTASTRINPKSSRSHAVFSLNLTQRKSKRTSSLPIDKRFSPPTESASGCDTITVDSKLHFVDLAGSERLKDSGLSGERAREGIPVDTGLASLAKVISQMSTRSLGTHVSYGGSRLTRLLQDSLGGNAITYMLACVNPIEFHLTETLNTIHYAQRARVIQSKPQIQHRLEDGDKQLVIDRLRSEIVSLRERSRLSERSDRKANVTDRSGGRKQDRENELQNQLLDVQENYSQLSQRHAKFMAEASQLNGHAPEQFSAFKSVLKNSSMYKIKTPSRFSDAIEHVILEYEKTIQNLESSLSNTRSALSTSESSLLEREGKIVYMEAVTQQLQSRIQKSADREASSESYMKDVEARLDGISNGEEKHMVIIKDLRKELARIRESEASAEDYIASLEERLAEAERDTDVMQREIQRLTQIVERQRCIGAADNMSHSNVEVPGRAGTQQSSGVTKNRISSPPTDMFHDRLVATTTAIHPNDDVLHETAEQEWKSFGPMEGDAESIISEQTMPDYESSHVQSSRTVYSNINGYGKADTGAQTTVLMDKLEVVTIELVELKIDHEATVNELNDISRKYQSALTTLAELRDAVSGVRPPPDAFAFLDGPLDTPELGTDAPHSSSRTLPSEFSSVGETPTLLDASETTPTMSSDRGTEHRLYNIGVPKEETLADSIRRLKRANAEKDINMAEIGENYSYLHDQHRDALNYIEELKDELQKADSTSAVVRSRTGLDESKRARLDSACLIAVRAQLMDGRKRIAAITGAMQDLANGQNARQTENAADQMLHTLDAIDITLEKAGHCADLSPASRHTIIGFEGLDPTGPRGSPPVTQIQREVELHKAIADARGAKLNQLESNFSTLSKKHAADADAHRHVVMDLEDKIDQQKSLATFHQQGIRTMQEAHARDLTELRASMAGGAADPALQHDTSGSSPEQTRLEHRVRELETQLARTGSPSVRPSSSFQLLPSPAPTMPLPPIPGASSQRPPTPRVLSPQPLQSASGAAAGGSGNVATLALLEEQEQRIRTIEKHLYAEKQLTATLEEALVELEGTANTTKADAAAWRRRAREAEDEAAGLRRERGTMRNSLQAVEEERDRRIRAEQARRQLEERMEALGRKKKGKGALNCF